MAKDKKPIKKKVIEQYEHQDKPKKGQLRWRD